MKLKILFKSSDSDITPVKKYPTTPTKGNFLGFNADKLNVLDLSMAHTPSSKSTRISNVAIEQNDYLIEFPSTTFEDYQSKTNVSISKSGIIAGLPKQTPLPNPPIFPNSTTLNNTNNSFLNSSNCTTPRKPDFTVLNVKSILSEKLKVKLDALVFFNFLEKNQKIKDWEDITNYIYCKLESFNLIVFYYKVLPNIQIITNIEYYQNNIDKIIFDLNQDANIYMVKYLILKKLKLDLPINEFLIFFSTISKEGNFYDDKNPSNHLKDDLTLNEIIEIYFPNSTTKILNLILVRKGGKRYSIGLDLSFTFMRNLKKINYEENAPSYREVSDGLNIFFYCYNPNCSIYNSMFTKNLGYDGFDVIQEINRTKCPLCRIGNKKQIEAISLGFINCEWNYKGILSNKSSSLISGDGITIDNKLYVIKETSLLSQFKKLEIIIKELSIEIQNNDNEILNNELDDDDFDYKISIKRKDLFNYEDDERKNLTNMNLHTENLYKNLMSHTSNTESHHEFNGIKMESTNSSCCFGIGKPKVKKEEAESKCTIF